MTIDKYCKACYMDSVDDEITYVPLYTIHF